MLRKRDVLVACLQHTLGQPCVFGAQYVARALRVDKRLKGLAAKLDRDPLGPIGRCGGKGVPVLMADQRRAPPALDCVRRLRLVSPADSEAARTRQTSAEGAAKCEGSEFARRLTHIVAAPI